MLACARLKISSLGLAVMLALCLQPNAPAVAQAPNLPDGVQALLAPAKAEGGTAVLYGADIDPTQAASLSKAMGEFYGASFDLKFISGLHPQKAAEIVQGAKMGVESGLDIFWTGDAIGALLDKGNVVADFDWFKTLAIDEKLRSGPKGLHIHDPMLSGVTYNTQLIPPADAPRSYEALVKNPAWKGKIAAPRAPNVFAFISYALGDEPTQQLIKDLVDVQDLKILPTYPDVSNRVLGGEFAIGIGVTPFLQHRKGAPVDAAPLDPVVLTPWAFWLMKDAKHPATAKLLGYWMVSPAGQKKLSEVAALSLATTPGTEVERLTEGKQVKSVPYEFNVDVLPKRAQVYGKLLGLR
jgi:ABC-type Fe3+ transport system substrate-binding protein